MTPRLIIYTTQAPVLTPPHEDSTPGTIICFAIPLTVCEQIRRAGCPCPDDAHVTLAFYGDAVPEHGALKDAVAQWAATQRPLVAETNGYGRFQGEDGDPVYLNVDAPGLPALRQELLEHLERTTGLCHNTEHGYTPHITLEYIESGAATPQLELEPIDITFEAVECWIGGEHYSYPFGGEEAGDDQLERASAVAHEVWMDWAQSLMDSEALSSDRVARWQEMMVPYDALSEEEKKKDREQARRYLAVL